MAKPKPPPKKRPRSQKRDPTSTLLLSSSLSLVAMLIAYAWLELRGGVKPTPAKTTTTTSAPAPSGWAEVDAGSVRRHGVACTIADLRADATPDVAAHIRSATPVMFRSTAANNATRRALTRRQLLKRWGRAKLGADTSGRFGHGGYAGQRMTLAKFLRKLSSALDLYFFDSLTGDFLRSCREVTGSTPLDAYAPPPEFARGSYTAEWASTSPRLTVGAAGSGIAFHLHAATYTELFYGRKRWSLYAPGTLPKVGYNPAAPHITWVESIWPTLSPAERPLECVQGPGDVLYIPDGWEHATLNLGETVSMARQSGRALLGSAQRLFDDAQRLLEGGGVGRGPKVVAAEAAAMLEKAVAMSPRSAHYFNALSNAYAALGDGRKSLGAAQRAFGANPQVAIVRETLAQSHLDLGELKAALQVLEAATDDKMHFDGSADFSKPMRRLLGLLSDDRLRGRAWKVAERWRADGYEPRLPDKT